ncbi:MAG: hypothetical protein LW636_02690 [Planctomycetaceae bacterium]|nr:hypothetical protein [Planctomycetaceae bacterium]
MSARAQGLRLVRTVVVSAAAIAIACVWTGCGGAIGTNRPLLQESPTAKPSISPSAPERGTGSDGTAATEAPAAAPTSPR